MARYSHCVKSARSVQPVDRRGYRHTDCQPGIDKRGCRYGKHTEYGRADAAYQLRRHVHDRHHGAHGDIVKYFPMREKELNRGFYIRLCARSRSPAFAETENRLRMRNN